MWSCGGNLSFPLELGVDLGNSSCLFKEVRPPLALRGAPRDSLHIAAGMNRASSGIRRELQGSSPFLILIAGSLQSWNRRARPPLVLSKGTSFSWSCSRGDSPLFELYLEPAAFSGGCNWGVSTPSCCDFFLRLHWKRFAGIGTYLEWTGKSVSFGMWH